MRNIANVVHDLAPTVENLDLKVSLITDRTNDFDQDMQEKLLDSIVTDINLLKDYLNNLKEEAKLNHLTKTDI